MEYDVPRQTVGQAGGQASGQAGGRADRRAGGRADDYVA